METIKLTYPHQLTIDQLPETIAAIGFFDGIHKGHQAVIETAVTKAHAQNKESAVISFYPHPSVVLNHSKKQVHYITPMDEKEKLLQEMNVDRLYIITFNKELSLLSPKEFIDHFINGLHITELVAGYDFTFGHKGSGNMKNIEELANGKFATTVINKVETQQDKISSTKIRNYLQLGDVDKVKALLGRHYITNGTVVEGDKRGRQLGFPTANVEINEDKLLPKQGVYAVKVIHDGKVHQGMANLGVIPTFLSGETKPSLEIYIFDFNEDIYGEHIIVQWCKFIREERKFNGVDEIVRQLKSDENTIRKYFT